MGYRYRRAGMDTGSAAVMLVVAIRAVGISAVAVDIVTAIVNGFRCVVAMAVSVVNRRGGMKVVSVVVGWIVIVAEVAVTRVVTVVRCCMAQARNVCVHAVDCSGAISE